MQKTLIEKFEKRGTESNRFDIIALFTFLKLRSYHDYLAVTEVYNEPSINWICFLILDKSMF